MEKKLFAGLYIIIITVSVLCGFLMLHISGMQNQNNILEDQTSEYQNQIDELENQIDEIEEQIYFLKTKAGAIEITKLVIGDDENPSLAIATYDVYVTVHNYRTSSVDRLTVSIGPSSDPMRDSASIEYLQAGETKTVTIHSGSQLDNNKLDVVTLWLNGEMIDERPLR